MPQMPIRSMRNFRRAIRRKQPRCMNHLWILHVRDVIVKRARLVRKMRMREEQWVVTSLAFSELQTGNIAKKRVQKNHSLCFYEMERIKCLSLEAACLAHRTLRSSASYLRSTGDIPIITVDYCLLMIGIMRAPQPVLRVCCGFVATYGLNRWSLASAFTAKLTFGVHCVTHGS